MLNLVGVKRKALRSYEPLIDDALVAEIRELAGQLRGLRVLHLNSTAYGGGVAELLVSMVGLEQDAGLDVEWRTMGEDEAFFKVTKRIHNALQGQACELTDEERAIYLRCNEAAAEALDGQYDAVIVHDPQPAAVRHVAGPRGARWIWRCHIDTSEPDAAVWAFVEPYIEEHDAAVFTMAQFVPPGLAVARLEFIPPAIDPLSSKNRDLPDDLVRALVGEFGVDAERPLMVQVARFDPWKDPAGVIQAYRLVKAEMPEVQLALIGSMAGDDPEAWEIYRSITETDRDDDLFVFTNLVGVGSLEVNCFQRAAAVVIQKSLREGFGLAVSEGLWKRRPVIGGAAGGIPLQLQDGVGGYLVTTVEQCAERALYLLRHPEEARRIAEAGHEVVRRRFLMPRLLRDELRLLDDVTTGAGAGRPGERAVR
jgi:trehalose synthase